MTDYDFSLGCNLSPLFFAIFICELGAILNSSKLGITLGLFIIALLLFADDIVLIAKDKKSLDIMMKLVTRFLHFHRLHISTAKSKVLTTDLGPITFYGDVTPSIELEAVCSFTYLGIPLNGSARCFFRDFNDKVQQKARRYLYSVLSLTRSGPDRSALAHTLWTNCALPAVLYGCEIMVLTKKTLDVLEQCNTQIGKFILQVPSRSANVSTYIDAGLRPIWAVVAEKVLLYARSVMTKENDYWPKLAMSYCLNEGLHVPYTKNLVKWMKEANTTIQSSALIKKDIHRSSISYVMNEYYRCSTTSFAMSPPLNTCSQKWFKLKTWVSDSAYSKTLAQFRCCNSGLGNRGPTKGGSFFKLCPLCEKQGIRTLNNEVHMIIECPSLKLYRESCYLGQFVCTHRALNPTISSIKLYSLFLEDSSPDKMKLKASCLYSMKVAWHTLMGIPM